MRDHYRILGVPDNAAQADIKAAYRRLAKLYHPDLNPGNKQSEERFKEILDAYTILSDETLRAQYDRKRNGLEPDYTNFFSAQNAKDNKRESQRKEYPPEYIEQMRQRNKQRVLWQIQRRKKLLRGMIVTFVLYIIGTAVFEAWVERQREKDSAELNRRLAEMRNKEPEQNNPAGIQNLDSPYDSLFGPGQTAWLSPNQLVVVNAAGAAVVCLVEEKSPNRTIRNEYIGGQRKFVMKEIPNGSYYVKVYLGSKWNDTLEIPDGRKLGRFSEGELFFRMDRPPIALQKPTYSNPQTITTDTVTIAPGKAGMIPITRVEFFSPGNKP